MSLWSRFLISFCARSAAIRIARVFSTTASCSAFFFASWSDSFLASSSAAARAEATTEISFSSFSFARSAFAASLVLNWMSCLSSPISFRARAVWSSNWIFFRKLKSWKRTYSNNALSIFLKLNSMLVALFYERVPLILELLLLSHNVFHGAIMTDHSF